MTLLCLFFDFVLICIGMGNVAYLYVPVAKILPCVTATIFLSTTICGVILVFRFCRDSSQWAMASSFTRFLDRTQRRATVGKITLDEWSARRRDLYLTTHNTHNRQTSRLPVGFEPTIPIGERPQTYALDRTATGIGNCAVQIGGNICLRQPDLCRNSACFNWAL